MLKQVSRSSVNLCLNLPEGMQSAPRSQGSAKTKLLLTLPFNPDQHAPEAQGPGRKKA